mmetsp:Transcript_27783/g.79745  ORF Transcript_27783/g.79745 Transcript_27783/m.79745 type:complete len:81 (-) Transcript_27783:116-358(-)
MGSAVFEPTNVAKSDHWQRRGTPTTSTRSPQTRKATVRHAHCAEPLDGDEAGHVGIGDEKHAGDAIGDGHVDGSLGNFGD